MREDRVGSCSSEEGEPTSLTWEGELAVQMEARLEEMRLANAHLQQVLEEDTS